jgi:hypothetical protein
LARYSSQCS